MIRLRAARAVVAWLCAVLVITACSVRPVTEDPDRPDPLGSLTTFLREDPGPTDPQRAVNTFQIKVVLMVYEGLLRPDPKTLRPVSAAADLPTISADGHTYNFRIRPGQTYSDGAPLTAGDFAYGLSRMCDPELEAPYRSVAFVIEACEDWAALDPAKETPQRLKAARDALFDRGLRVKGDHELEIVLVRPAAYLPSFLALWVSAPVRERDIVRGGDRWWIDPELYIGNGPFVLSERITDEQLVFVPNQRARVDAKLARWTMRPGPQRLTPAEWQAQQLEAYRRDEGDIVSLSIGDVATVEQDESLKADLAEAPASCSRYVRFDTSLPPFDDPKLRLALAKSIDREAFARVESARRRPATSLIPPGIPGHDPADDGQVFDPEAARRLLAESAYGGRFPAIEWPFWATFTKATNEWIAAQWRTHLGIEITPKLVSANEFAELYRSRDTSPRLFRAVWCADYPDQQNWLSTLFHSKSKIWLLPCEAVAATCASPYASPSFDRLVDEADALPDQAKRDELYLQASRLLSADAPGIWLGYDITVRLVKPWVRGLNANAIDAGGIYHPADVYVVKRP